MVFVGSLQGKLSLKDVVATANTITDGRLSIDAILKAVPNIAFENVKLQVVPVETTIVGQRFAQGIAFEGGVLILNSTTTMKIAVSEDGLNGFAKLPEIKIPGVLALKGLKGADGLVEPPEAILTIDKSSSKSAELYAKGLVELAPAILGGVTAEGVINFSTSGLEIKLASELFDHFTFDVTMEGKGLSVESLGGRSKVPTNFMIKASMAAEGGLGELTNRFRKIVLEKLGDPTAMKDKAHDKMGECISEKFADKF
jgi:hypothetical protein